jgi:hypothetical protein
VFDTVISSHGLGKVSVDQSSLKVTRFA